MPLVGIGTLPTPFSPASVPLPPETGGRGPTSLRVGGWGESQFRRGAYTVVLFICTYFVSTVSQIHLIYRMHCRFFQYKKGSRRFKHLRNQPLRKIFSAFALYDNFNFMPVLYSMSKTSDYEGNPKRRKRLCRL